MIKDIANYLLAKVPDSFAGWTREAVEDYVMFHAEQGTMKVVAKLLKEFLKALSIRKF